MAYFEANNPTRRPLSPETPVVYAPGCQYDPETGVIRQAGQGKGRLPDPENQAAMQVLKYNAIIKLEIIKKNVRTLRLTFDIIPPSLSSLSDYFHHALSQISVRLYHQD